jgi:hypothetical protein
MRQAINENRTVQLALVAVLVLVGGFMLLKVTKGSGNETATTAAAPGTTAAPATGTATTAPATGTAPAAVDPTTGLPVSTAAPAGTGSVPANLVPGPGLPKSLLSAYHNGKAVVLLVRRAGGIDDNLVHGSVNLLGSSSVAPDIKIFVTRAQQISRYTWLTQGVDVTELPALIVLRPRGLTKGTPSATVSYGFRDSASVLQAVKDAIYRGPAHRPYHP